MKTKHTPGPWKVRKREGWNDFAIIYAREDLAQPDVATVTNGRDKTVISINGRTTKTAPTIALLNEFPSYKASPDGLMKIVEANANLISAAPDLLNALECMLVEFSASGVTELGWSDKNLKKINATIKMAEDAISKASGQK